MRFADDLPCQEFVELVTDYLEGTLDPDVYASFESHLDVCTGCKLYLGQIRLTIRALRSRQRRTLSSESRQKLLQNFRQWRS